MRFNRDDVSDLTIRRIEPGAIHIGSERFKENVALTADEIVRDWPDCRPDLLKPADLERILALQPEMIIVGTGWRQELPPRDLVFAMARRGIGIEFMDTPAACRTFNILIGEGRRPAALLLFSG
jgi:uncharacterized protein